MKTEFEIRQFRDAMAAFVVSPCNCIVPEDAKRCREARSVAMFRMQVLDWILCERPCMDELAKFLVVEMLERPARV